MSNRPPPLTARRDPVNTNATHKSMSGTGLFASPGKPATSSSQQSPSVSTNVMRDEMVRVLMPELRKLVEDSVNKAIERATAPLLEKQRQLEVELIELRAEHKRAAPPPKPAVAPAPEMTAHTATTDTPSVPVVVETRPNPPPVLNIQKAVSPPQIAPIAERKIAYAVASTSGTLDDIPAELNGAHRKRIVVWAFSILVLVSLLCAIALSVASNMGKYF